MTITFGTEEAQAIREQDVEKYGAGLSRWLITVAVEHYYFVTAASSDDARERYKEGDYEDGGSGDDIEIVDVARYGSTP